MSIEDNVGGDGASPAPDKRNALLMCCLVALLFLHVSVYRRYLPNQWLGDLGYFGFAWWQPLALIVFFAIAASILLKRKSPIPVLFLTLFAFVPCFFPVELGPQFRVNLERNRYLEVARGGDPYGDQHEAVVDGRRLIYWRWVSWGLDDSIGVIYDPEDRLIQGSLDELERHSPDFRAFSDVAQGHLGSSRKMGDGLYLVTHT